MTAIFTLSGGSGDCWGDNSDFDSAGTSLFLGHDSGVGNTNRTSVWIPFTVNLPQGRAILSATLKFVASQTRSDSVTLRVGCEDADNPSAPVDAADVSGRIQTGNYTNYSPGSFTEGVQYSVSVTSAVQEVLDRSGWTSGNTLAILIKNLVSDSTDYRRLIAAYEHSSYAQPILEITVDDFVPQMIGII